MTPFSSARKRTPTSICVPSLIAVSPGTMAPNSEQGHDRSVTITDRPADAAPRLPLSSAARLSSVTAPSRSGVQV